MKKLLLLLFSFFSVGCVWADFTEPGYYRLKNVYTQRYVTVIDNSCEFVDIVAGKIDGHSLATQQDFSEICHDPASVIYAARVSGSHYDVAAQGESLKNMMNYNINLKEYGKEGNQITYRIYATEKGVTKYLADNGSPNKTTGLIQFGTPSASSQTSNLRCNWMILPIDARDDNYFGVLPTVDASQGYWASLYASFPYSAFTQGLEFYYAAEVASTGVVLMKEITGVVAGGTPVIVRCSSAQPTNNRLVIGGTGGTKPSRNYLKGQYFNCYANRGQYINRIAYDKETMRVLGKCADGSLGFIVDETLDFIPANTAYMIVEPWYPKELRCVFTQEEYDTHVEKIFADESQQHDVYSVSGIKMLEKADESKLRTLPSGVYIVDGKKRVIK